jgi:nitrogen fixation protein FixH
MNVWMRVAVAAAILGALGAILATIWVGSKVREETVVAKPYEEGLRHDAEKAARAALGLSVTLIDPAPEAGVGPLAFDLADRDGRPVTGARVRVELSQPDTGRGGVAAGARELGGGRYAADVAFPSAGPWDVRFDVARGEERVRLERRVAAGVPCDVGDGPCTRPLDGGGEVTLELAPRPLRTMQDLAVRVQVAGAPDGAAKVSVAFAMPGMEMGENRAALAPTGGGRFEGKAVLVRCPSGRRDWVAEVQVASEISSRARTARFRASVRE